jgi:serine/threonine-protein kinase SRPK3
MYVRSFVILHDYVAHTYVSTFKVYEMVMGKPLLKRDIQPQSVPYFHTILFGDYPVNMIKRGKYSNVFFNSNGECFWLLFSSNGIPMTMSSMLSSSTLQVLMPDHISLELDILKRGAPPNHEQFIGFLKLMFVLDPENRASLDQLLAHKWLWT